jgi:sec-independent protein translocase protein TatA
MISTSLFAIALPFLGGVGAPELIIILVIVLILFGPKRLPQLGKSIGKTMKSIRDGVDGKLDAAEEDDEDAPAKAEAKGEPAKAAAKSEDDSKES